MLSLATALLIAQPVHIDPLSRGMSELCQSKPACMTRQRQGVRQFLDSIVIYRPNQARIQRCLGSAARKRGTDWVKAAGCLRAWGRKSAR